MINLSSSILLFFFLSFFLLSFFLFSYPFLSFFSFISFSRIAITDSIYEVISGTTHLQGEPEDITNYIWYHGRISQSTVERMLEKKGVIPGSFLIWLTFTNNCFALSWKRLDESISHHDIRYNYSNGYYLKDREAPKGKFFKSVVEMIAYYQEFPIFAGSEARPGNGASSSSSSTREVLTDAIPCRTSGT